MLRVRSKVFTANHALLKPSRVPSNQSRFTTSRSVSIQKIPQKIIHCSRSTTFMQIRIHAGTRISTSSSSERCGKSSFRRYNNTSSLSSSSSHLLMNHRHRYDVKLSQLSCHRHRKLTTNTSTSKSLLRKLSTSSFSSTSTRESSQSLPFQSNNNNNNNSNIHNNNNNIRYPTSSNNNTTTTNNSKTTSYNDDVSTVFDLRKQELIEYMKNALAYELEQIIDLVDDDDDDDDHDTNEHEHEQNHGDPIMTKRYNKNHRKYKSLRERMHNKYNAEKRRNKRRLFLEQQQQQRQQERNQVMLDSTTMNGITSAATNENMVDEDENIILTLPTAKELSSSSSSSSTSTSELPSSLLSLLEENDPQPTPTESDNFTTATNTFNKSISTTSTSTTTTTTNLVDLLDDDDYGFDIDENEIEEDTSLNNNVNTIHDISGSSSSVTSSVTNNTMNPKQENQLLSLLQDEEEYPNQDKKSTKSESKKRSLLDLLDDYNDDGQPTSSSNTTASTSTMQSSPSLSLDDEYSSKSSTSLLDQLNDYDDSERIKSIEGTTDIRQNESTTTTTTAAANKTSSLLDLLNDDDNDLNVNKQDFLHVSENKNIINDTNENLPNEPKMGSLLDLLDSDAEENFTSQDGSMNNEENRTRGSNSSSTLLDMLDEDNSGNIPSETSFDDNYPMNQDRVDTHDRQRKIKLDTLLLKLKSLLSVMKRKDWNRYLYKMKNLETVEQTDKFDHYDGTETNSLENDDIIIEEEIVSNDDVLEQPLEYNKEESTLIASLIDELLIGVQQNRWHLQTNEFNLLLLYVATSNLRDKGEYLLEIFLNMKELGSSGFETSAPNADTFVILMKVFDTLEKSTAVAAELGVQMIEYGQNNDVDFQLEGQTLNLAMRMFAKRLDLEKAETLMDWARNEEIQIEPSTFLPLLELYKKENQQEEALKLIEECIKINGETRSVGVNSFLSSAINWPRKNREGKSIATSSYYEALLENLESIESFRINFNLWKKLLFTTMNVAKFESFESWALVHQCCRSLLDHEEMNERKMDASIVKIGLQVAELTNDTKLAADIICNVGGARMQTMDDFYPQPEGNFHLSIPQSTYMKIMKMCVNAGDMNSSEKILRHATNNDIPKTNLSSLYFLVLNGHAMSGNLESTEQMLNEMEELEIPACESSYAALIHAYAKNNLHDKAAEVLDSMINGLYGDHIQPSLSTFTASMLAAMSTNDWKKVLEIDHLMHERGIKPSGTTLQGVLLANFREKEIDQAKKVIEDAIESKAPTDKATFLLCIKYLLPSLYANNGDITSIRNELRTMMTSNRDNSFADKAMELNKRLRDCTMEDQRKPSKTRNSVMIQKERERQWRLALRDAVDLSNLSED